MKQVIKRETFTGYITKYALTRGILCRQLSETSQAGMVYETANGLSYYHGSEWHRDLDSAIAQAEKMRLAKVKSLSDQLDRLRQYRFTGVAREQ